MLHSRHTAPGPLNPVVHVGRHAWLPTLLVGGALFLGDERVLVSTQNPNFVPSAILLGALVVPLAFLVFVYGRRLPYDVPAGVLWTTTLVSGIVGTIVAGVLEFRTLQGLGGLAMLGVGLIEEAAKLVVPLLVVLLLPYRRPADGLLLGVASGAGFAALETMGYAFVALLKTSGDVASVGNLLLLRGVLSPAGHMAWTGIAAGALYMAAQDGWSARGLRRFALVFLVVALLHAAWDGIGTLPAFAAISLGSLLLLGWTVHRVGPRHEVPEPARAPLAAET